MSLLESVWADDNLDDLLFENATRTIDGASSAFDANAGLEFGNHCSDSYSTKRDHANHEPIVFDHGHTTFEDQQLVGYSSANQNMSAADDQEHHEEQSVTSDSGECHDKSVLDLKPDI